MKSRNMEGPSSFLIRLRRGPCLEERAPRSLSDIAQENIKSIC
jgi:hypothetical protein